MTGGSRTRHPRLTLHGTVSSSFTPTLRSTFGDTAFSVGGIQGGISPSFPVIEAVEYSILLLLAFLLLVALLVVVGLFAARRARLVGNLTAKAAGGQSLPVPLRGWRVSTRIDGLIGNQAAWSYTVLRSAAR